MYTNMSPFTHVHKWNINESNKDDYEIAENTCEIIKKAMRNDGRLWWCNKKKLETRQEVSIKED